VRSQPGPSGGIGRLTAVGIIAVQHLFHFRTHHGVATGLCEGPQILRGSLVKINMRIIESPKVFESSEHLRIPVTARQCILPKKPDIVQIAQIHTPTPPSPPIHKHARPPPWPPRRAETGRRVGTQSPSPASSVLTPARRKITFIDKDSQSHTFTVADGANLLDIAQAHDLDMEGACGGSCACSTCHVIVEDEGMYEKMEEPDDDENDMLDLAFGLTETSRLGCQVVMRKELDGLVVKLPRITRNLQASDFK